MSPVVRRTGFSVLLLLLVFVAAQHRLGDGGSIPGRPDGAPDLWREARHANRAASVTHAASVTNCALLLSLDRNNPYTLTSVDDGVLFDIDADGDAEQVSWPEPSSNVAFLAIDHEGDGRVSSGRDLIGNHTVPGVTSAPNALLRLATDAIGGELRGSVDSEHPLFRRLLLWTDDNHNGVSEGSELVPAGELLAAVGLGFGFHHREDAHGNQSRFRGFVHVRTESGRNRPTSPEDDHARNRPLYDVCLVTSHKQPPLLDTRRADR